MIDTIKKLCQFDVADLDDNYIKKRTGRPIATARYGWTKYCYCVGYNDAVEKAQESLSTLVTRLEELEAENERLQLQVAQYDYNSDAATSLSDALFASLEKGEQQAKRIAGLEGLLKRVVMDAMLTGLSEKAGWDALTSEIEQALKGKSDV